jgi:hypothetical protein
MSGRFEGGKWGLAAMATQARRGTVYEQVDSVSLNRLDFQVRIVGMPLCFPDYA